MLWIPRFETEHGYETGEVQWKVHGRPHTRFFCSNIDQAILVETHEIATLLTLGPEAFCTVARPQHGSRLWAQHAQAGNLIEATEMRPR